MSNVQLGFTQIIDPVSFKPVLSGKIYIGEYGTLPNPSNSGTWKQAYFVNSDGTRTAASQPIATNAAGYAVDGSGNIKSVQVDGKYSILVQNALSVTKFALPKVFDSIDSSQIDIGNGHSLSEKLTYFPDVISYVVDTDSGDHALAWKRAIIAANGRPINVAGNWTFLTDVDASGYDVNMYGTASIDATAVSAAYPMTLGGTLGSSSALGADVAKGAAGITCALSVQPGDIIKIVSTDQWSTERSYYVKGELQRVLSASGGTIYLQGQLNDGYTAATTTVTKINAASVRIDNKIEINRQSDTKGALLIQWAKDLAVNSLSTIQARERGIYVKECLGGYVADGQTVASFPVGGTSNYGLVYDSCAEISTIRGNYHAGRHGISTGGTFPCRDMLFDNCIVDNDSASGAYCLDAHANAERFIYRNMFSKNGALIQAIDCEFTGGHYLVRDYQYSLLFAFGRNANKTTVLGGIYDASNVTNSRAIALSATVANLNLGSLFIGGGAKLYANNPFFHIPFSSGTTTVNEITLDGIEAVSNGTSSTAGIYINTNTQNPIVGLFRLRNSKTSTSANGPNLTLGSGAVTYTEVQVINNQMTQSGALNVAFVQRATLAKVHGNTCYGNSTALRFELNTCVNTDVRNNNMYGFTSNGGILLNSSTGIDMAIGNFTDAAAGFTFPAGTIIDQGPNNRRVFQRAAAPTTGTYLVGDRTVNSSPAVGQPKAWVCTVAGTPGTWTSEGNL